MAQKPNAIPAGLTARTAASEIIWRVLIDGTYLDDAFARTISDYRLDSRDRALVRAISATTLRRLGQVRTALDRHMKKPLAPKFAHAACIIYTASTQILFMDVPDHAAIDLAVAQLRRQRKLHHLSGMANAVLRKLVGEKRQVISQTDAGQLNTPKWLWQLWAKDYGKQVAAKIADAHLHEAALDLTPKSGAEHLGAEHPDALQLPTGSLRLKNASGPIEQLAGYQQGNWWVQDFAASLPVRLLGDVAGKTVADICAAPGGKTMQLAAGKAQVTAVDISPQRLERVKENLARCGLAAEIICADILDWQPETVFDALLLDAPCSATGTIRRHPDALYLKKSHDIDALCKLQKELLAKAAAMIKPGGDIIYCTCSLQKREGELQIENFLTDNKNFQRRPVSAGQIGGMDHLINEHGDLRTLPFYSVGDSTGMDGFFISRLNRQK